MESEKEEMELLRWSHAEIIECQSTEGRHRLDSVEAQSEIGDAIEVFRQKAIAAIHAGRLANLISAADEMDARVVGIAQRFVGRKYTFDVASTRQWRQMIMLAVI